jgi:EAL domain-containing protein (putative c-di-GMP-specific phosphodiesterase class I)
MAEQGGNMVIQGAPKPASSDAATPAVAARAVLLVDDEAEVLRALHGVLTAAGYDVWLATAGKQALEAIMSRSYDVIVSDISMPGMSGIALLRSVRERDLDVPVILMTGQPTLETAMEAMSLGAVKYLAKPFSNAELVKAVERASRLHRISKIKRDSMKMLGANAAAAGDRAGLEVGLDGALASLWMAFQPIVVSETGRVFAHEALMRSSEPSLPHPGAILHAAERLGRLTDVGRRVRTLSAAAFASAPVDALLFVNLHTSDLLDEDLYSPDAPLSAIASRVVLEITERASLDEVKDVMARVARLRTMGFRVAIDDLGAGFAGLSSFVALEPEFVKLDISLVRDVHKSEIRQRLVGSLTATCAELGILVVAEGIECAEDRDSVRALGCNLLQGYFFARPGPAFPEIIGRVSEP